MLVVFRCKASTVIVLVALALNPFEFVSSHGRAQAVSQDTLHYDKYVEKYDRMKPSIGNLQERLSNFIGRTIEIFEHNMLFLRREVSYHLEVNQFADMSFKDLSKMLLNAEDLTDNNDDDKKEHKAPVHSNAKQWSVLDFRKRLKDQDTKSFEQFLDLKDRVGEILVNKVINLKEAFESAHDMNQDHSSKGLNPLEAIMSNLDKMRKPLLEILESAKGAFWEYLKDEGIVKDVGRHVKERAAEVKRIRMKIDWRITECIGQPRQQSLCNSCYAISVVSLIEYYYCREMGELKRFSPQHIVDCGKPFGMRGCEGGRLSSVGQFIQENGLRFEADFPYTGLEGQCGLGSTDKSSQMRPYFKYWQHLQGNGTADEWLRHARKGPLLVGIGMPADFFAYGGGIHDGHNCDPRMVHSMLLVGYGIQDDKEFWLLQNSYSNDWGENGYFRLLKDAPPECFNAAIVARPSFDELTSKL